MQLTRKIVSAFATVSLLANSLAPLALADTDLTISGNGAFTSNNVDVSQAQSTTVVQSNDANVVNDVDVHASTGGNDANFNTGGDVAIVTGNAISDVDLSTKVNSNTALVNDCNGCNTDHTVTVSGNGAYSNNDVTLNSANDTSVFQTNNANIRNDVDINASTGKNDANFNTGGDVAIVTGHALSNVDINNVANANVAHIGGGSGATSGSVDVLVSGNGAFSISDVNLNLNRSSTLVQDNYARIRNDVDVNASTGHNDANFNTGGDILIDTGNAESHVGINNLANFNAASLDCGCLLDLSAKISGNGYGSYNNIYAYLNDYKNVFQDNYSYLKNYVDVDPKTGHNDIEFSTGSVGSDPLILTGHAISHVGIDNLANKNVYGSFEGLHLPSHVSLHFDMWELLSHLHLT